MHTLHTHLNISFLHCAHIETHPLHIAHTSKHILHCISTQTYSASIPYTFKYILCAFLPHPSSSYSQVKCIPCSQTMCCKTFVTWFSNSKKHCPAYTPAPQECCAPPCLASLLAIGHLLIVAPLILDGHSVGLVQSNYFQEELPQNCKVCSPKHQRSMNYAQFGQQLPQWYSFFPPH